MKSLLILGRQPALGLAELESLYASDAIAQVGTEAVLLDIPPEEINIDGLGGAMKLCKVLNILDTNNWGAIQKYLEKSVPQHASSLPEGKLQLGISAYDLNTSSKRILATGLTLKKLLRSTGRSVRLTPNAEPALNTAQVIHNGLLREMGWELVLVKHGTKTILAQTVAVQDIEAYRRRDQERPARDARVGMLPPKLAQIIINLARPKADATILDPFCGTGVVLQEALLMDFSAIGTDLEPRMVDYSTKNIEWLKNKIALKKDAGPLSVADATTHRWKENFDTIACETYLGRALSSHPDQETLAKIMNDCDTIHAKFLKNLARQTEPGFRMCIAVPAWKTKNGFKHLRCLDNLADLGYTRMSFVHARNQDLIYHRADQIVARELVVLIRR